MYVLELNKQHVESLGVIRHWTHLKIARDGDTYWVKGFHSHDMETVEVKSIPFKNMFTLNENRLIPYGATLPIKKISTTLLWTPIDKGLQVLLPNFNNNFFGISDTVEVRLILDNQWQPAYALLLPFDTIATYIETASQIRLKPLQWLILPNKSVLIIGEPLLSLPGQTYWIKEDFLLPSGYNLNFDLLIPELKSRINPYGDYLVWWNMDNTYSLLEKKAFVPLSISSFRNSFNYSGEWQK